MPSGGSRPGAGRPRLREKYGGQIAAVEDRIAERLPSFIENMSILADGVTVEEEMPNGGVKVYTRVPDRQANEYLINRIMGKPTERHEHDFSDLSDDELLGRITGALVGGGEAGPDPEEDGG